VKLVEYFRLQRTLGLNWRVWSGILVLQGLSTIFEGIGIGMFLPVLQYLESGGDMASLAARSQAWQVLTSAFSAVGAKPTFAALLVIVFLCFLTRQAVFYVRRVYMVRRREAIVRLSRNEMFRRYLATRAAYHDKMPVGEMVNALTIELKWAIDGLFGPPQIACQALVIVGLLSVLLVVSSPTIVLALVVMAASGLLLAGLFRATARSGEQLMDDNRMLATFLVQRLDSPRLIRLAGTEQAELDLQDRLSNRQCESMVATRTLIARGEVMYEPLAILILLGMLYFGTTMLGVTIGEFAVLFLVAVRLLPTVKDALSQWQGTVSIIPHLAAFGRRLDEMVVAAEPRGGDQRFVRLAQAARFEDVAFRYPESDRPALSGVTVEIPARQLTAIVGPSGAGKSTLVDMLLALRVPHSGRITLDNVPIGEFDVASLRYGIAYAPQSPQIFDVTVREHIAYGKPGATDSEIMQAAQLAGADDFIAALPQGYNTYVGEDGIRLSGGQRHRLDLARALVRGASMLVLDEPTSALDADAEESFRTAIADLRTKGGMTIIVIAHRLSTVLGADRIIVLRDGRVEDMGCHEELLRRGGWYAQAFAKQVVANVDQKEAARA
jgi:ABC-type multidrug transport system fused ATPase/permease subunit